MELLPIAAFSSRDSVEESAHNCFLFLREVYNARLSDQENKAGLAGELCESCSWDSDESLNINRDVDIENRLEEIRRPLVSLREELWNTQYSKNNRRAFSDDYVDDGDPAAVSTRRRRRSAKRADDEDDDDGVRPQAGQARRKEKDNAHAHKPRDGKQKFRAFEHAPPVSPALEIENDVKIFKTTRSTSQDMYVGFSELAYPPPRDSCGNIENDDFGDIPEMYTSRDMLISLDRLVEAFVLRGVAGKYELAAEAQALLDGQLVGFRALTCLILVDGLLCELSYFQMLCETDEHHFCIISRFSS